MPKKARLSLEIDRATRKRLETLKSAVDGASLTGVIRIALHLLEAVVRHQLGGGVVVFRAKSGSERVVEFFLKSPE